MYILSSGEISLFSGIASKVADSLSGSTSRITLHSAISLRSLANESGGYQEVLWPLLPKIYSTNLQTR